MCDSLEADYENTLGDVKTEIPVWIRSYAATPAGIHRDTVGRPREANNKEGRKWSLQLKLPRQTKRAA